MKRLATLSLVFLASAVSAQQGSLTGIDSYIGRALHEFAVPGAALAVVKDGNAVFVKGYGVRELGRPGPVTANTRFAIGSMSKSFTATSMAILVDEKRVRWDDHVTQHLPWFEMYDPWVTREITIRDVLSHRSGLRDVSAGTAWYGSDYSREEIIRKLRYLKPVTSFRSDFAYQNVMYLVAGEVIHAASGKSWDEFVRDRILVPLGMTSTTTTIPSGATVDLASPHVRLDAGIRPVAHRPYDNVGPAAAIYSTANDLVAYTKLHLDRGQLGEKRVFSEQAAKEMYGSQMIVVPSPRDPPKGFEQLKRNFLTYGFGWFLYEYQGRKIIEHGGGVDGFATEMMLVPDLRLGIVVLTNQELPWFALAVANRIIDGYLGLPETDWISFYRDRAEKTEKNLLDETEKIEKSHVTGTNPSLPMDAFAGIYRDVFYGDVSVVNENGKLVLRFTHTPSFTADLRHWHYDTFRTEWRDPTVSSLRSLSSKEPGFVSFSLRSDGKVDALKFDGPKLLDADFEELDFHKVP